MPALVDDVVLLDRCPACDSRHFDAHGMKGTLTLSRCLTCTLLFSNPQPRGAVRKEYIEELDLAEHFTERAVRKDVLFRRRLQSLPAASAGRNSLCDIGCGDGQFLELARSAGWNGLGIEPNPSAAQRVRTRGLPVIHSTLEQAEGLQSRRFDVVTAWDVLEHTPEPAAFVKKLESLVAPGGLAFVSTLNCRSFAFLLFGMRWSMISQSHFTYWSHASLAALFTRSKLHPLRWETFGLGRDFVAWMDRYRAPRARSSAPRGQGRTWDVHPVVLATESLANRALRLTGRGVDITMLLRRTRP